MNYLNWYKFKEIRGTKTFSDKNPFYGVSPMSELKLQKERPMNLPEFSVNIIDRCRSNEVWQMTYDPVNHIFEISGDRVNGIIKKKIECGTYHPFVLLYWQNT